MSFFLFLLTHGIASADFADWVAPKAAVPDPSAARMASTQLTFSEHMATFWDRNSPLDFIYEFLAILVLGVYVGLHFVGKARSEQIAKDKFQSIYRQLYDNFALVGVQQGAAPLSKEGPDRFPSYVSGRKNIEFGHLEIQTFPRHDLIIGYGIKTLYGIYFDQETITDRLTLEFTLPPVFDGFVFGILHKSVMRFQRIDNWDLQFTKTNDATFSSAFVVMTEVAEPSEKLITKELKQIVTDMTDSLEYIVVSDQPTKQPKDGEQNRNLRTLRLSVLLGGSSATETNLNMLLASVLSIADALPQSGKLSANSLKKLSSARDETYKSIAKQLAAVEAEDAPKRITRKEIREKEKKEAIGKLSAKEQKKAIEKERERQLRKTQGKMSRKA